mmetsp:Transcript_13405/g.22045  ORF Transcript_13405/g.22045 Transcript_13405/m.22045 type:complete len:278 (+) Transcript_13405:172-1005(+)
MRTFQKLSKLFQCLFVGELRFFCLTLRTLCRCRRLFCTLDGLTVSFNTGSGRRRKGSVFFLCLLLAHFYLNLHALSVSNDLFQKLHDTTAVCLPLVYFWFRGWRRHTSVCIHFRKAIKFLQTSRCHLQDLNCCTLVSHGCLVKLVLRFALLASLLQTDFHLCYLGLKISNLLCKSFKGIRKLLMLVCKVSFCLFFFFDFVLCLIYIFFASFPFFILLLLLSFQLSKQLVHNFLDFGKRIQFYTHGQRSQLPIAMFSCNFHNTLHCPSGCFFLCSGTC